MNYTQYAKDNFSRDRFAINQTGVIIEEACEGYARCSMKVEDWHLNNNDKVMGGAIFTLADYAFGVAANTPKTNCVSLNATVNFIRSTTGPVLYAEAKCVKDGRNICFFNVVVTDSEDRIIATVATDGFRSEVNKKQ